MTTTRSFFIAWLALPAAALAQAQGGGQQPATYTMPPAPPLTLDPTGGGPIAPGAPPNPYAPPGSGQVLGTQQPVPGGNLPPQPMQPEGQQAPQGIYLGGHVASAGAEPQNEGEVPEVHVVQKGDTLWDICRFYFKNPWRWPEIWGLNPQITNPHWIYPGNVVRLLASAGTPQATAPTAAPAAAQPSAEAVAQLRQIAFVGLADLQAAGTISGSTDEKLMLSTGDEVFVDYPDGKPPQMDTRYSVYIPDRDILEPGTKQVIGKYVVIRGELKITEVKKDKAARAVITDITNQGTIERGQKVGPLKTQFRDLKEVAADANVEGLIAGVLQGTQIIGSGQVVFIDRGSADGVKPGNRMIVVRRGDAYPEAGTLTQAKDDRHFPETDFGALTILQVADRTSVAWTARTQSDLQVGDHVVMRKSK